MDPRTREVYFGMLECPSPSHMLVMADAVEEFEGDGRTAAAYRWAATKALWPLRRAGRGSKVWDTQEFVYDWDGAHKEGDFAPGYSRLPRGLYQAIRDLKDKKYGTVHMAFVLLGRGLELAPDAGKDPADADR